MTDFQAHLTRQMAFSRATWGPGKRQRGIVEHLRKELIELEESGGAPEEWADIVLLALDGLLRSNAFNNPDRPLTSDGSAKAALQDILFKQSKNELRVWPNWREASQNEAIEHKRGTHD